MNFIREVSNLFHRMKYPVSLPEEVCSDLGLPMESCHPLLTDLLSSFTSPACTPSKLKKFMTRDEVEKLFLHAKKSESFRYNTLFSYCFNTGWLAFDLVFDENSKLRRLYVKHKDLQAPEEGLEITLSCDEAELKKIW